MTVVVRDCLEPTERLVSFEAARLAAVSLADSIRRVENVNLADARGRVLAEPVAAVRALPPFDQAAMDGYAIALSGHTGTPLFLPVAGRTEAGDPPAGLEPGTAHRIMTGAALPRRADTVVMQEHVSLHDDGIEVPADIPANANIRRAGEDVSPGALVLEKGRLIGWPEIALLAALGVARVAVAAPVRILILTTGSELRNAGDELEAGQIYDSNGPMLAALLTSPSVSVTTRAIGDDLDALSSALDSLVDGADLVITTAGMADGDRDYVRAAVARAGGSLDIVKVAMKPGKPLALGRLRHACFVGLPGNPQAVAFAALAFIRPLLSAIRNTPQPDHMTARLAFPWKCRRRRAELLPVSLSICEGQWIARRSGPDGSHRIMPMVDADAVAVLPGTAETLQAGTLIEVLPFDQARFRR